MFSVEEIIQRYKPAEAKENTSSKQNKVINHTRMEKLIFNDKKNKIDEAYKSFDYTIDETEAKGNEKLSSFEHMSQDLFNMFYKLAPEMRAEEELNDNVARYNKKILERVRENPDYQPLKLITEGKDYESIEGTREFLNNLYNNLDDLMKDIGGDKETQNQLDKTKEALKSKSEQLESAISIYNKMKLSGKSSDEIKGAEQKVQSLYKQIESMEKKVKDWEDIIQGNVYANRGEIDQKINEAMTKALEKVNGIKDAIDAFGNGAGNNDMNIEGKSSLIKRVNSNSKFKEMAKVIGKMRRLAKSQLNREFIHGRGEKVGIEYGNNLRKILASEFSLLAQKETKPLFYRKYFNKKLKQYSEKTTEFKGRGHIICCRDESGSTAGGREFWAKAISIALLDVAVKEKRKYADIPFGYRLGRGTEVNSSNYNESLVLDICNNFMHDSGTNFTKPLEKAIELLESNEYDGADVVFITDGHAEVSDSVIERLEKVKKTKKSKIVGVLLDRGGRGYVSHKTIKRFCDKVYKTSDLTEEEIAKNLLGSVI